MACKRALGAPDTPLGIFLSENGASPLPGFFPTAQALLKGPQVTALAWLLPEQLRAYSAPRTWPPPRALSWMQEGPALPGEASSPATVLSSHWPPVRGLCRAPRPWKGKAWAGGTEPGGPLGKMTDRPWGQAFGACSGQEFSRPEIAVSAPPHSCPRPELATPGDWTLPAWELGLEDAVCSNPPPPKTGCPTPWPRVHRKLKEVPSG